MKVTGKLFKKFDTQQVSDRFKKREFVLEYADNPEYPQFVLFQMTQDRVSVIDNFEVGMKIDVDFNLRGREWTNPQGEKKYFNSLEAWRIGLAQGDNSESSSDDVQVLETDDMPF